MFNYFDHWTRSTNGGVFVGEYAVTSNDAGATTWWSTLQNAVAEAVFMIGLERNSDIVKMASYAPLLEHWDLAEWSPDLIGYDARPGSICGSPSYYVQKMFSNARGATILPVTSDTGFGPVYWVASVTAGGTYHVKLANYGTTAQSVTVKIPAATAAPGASLEVLTGDPLAVNKVFTVQTVPTTSTVTGSATGGWTFSLPAYSVAVLTVLP